MGLHSDFPPDPYAILDPAVRWYPGEAMLDELGYEMLLPPLVHKVRQGVKCWRDAGYDGASRWILERKMLPVSETRPIWS